MASNQKMQENKPTLKFNFTIEKRWPVSIFELFGPQHLSHWALIIIFRTKTPWSSWGMCLIIIMAAKAILTVMVTETPTKNFFRCHDPGSRCFEHMPASQDPLQGRTVSYFCYVDDIIDHLNSASDQMVIKCSRWSPWRQVSGNVGAAWTPNWGSVGGVGGSCHHVIIN